jgi:diketogulonate reductase-like aldo/keto reductase
MGEIPARRAREVAAIHHALQIGYRIFDTAEIYAAGGAEAVLGEALQGFDIVPRSQLFIVSKVAAANATRSGTVRSCEASIGRLGCDYLDLYLLHWPGPVPFTETLYGFRELLRRRLVKHVGVSNFDADDLQRWLGTARRVGVPGGASTCNQVPYCPAERGIEYGLLPWQQQHGIPTMVYSALRQGALASHPVLSRIGRERGATAAQVAMAWCLRHRDVVVVTKSIDPERLSENLAAADMQLDPAEIRQIDAAFALQLRWLRENRSLRHARTVWRRLSRHRRWATRLDPAASSPSPARP